MDDSAPAHGPDPEWMVIGLVAGAFGVQGEMKVDLLTDFPERFKALKEVYIGPARTAFVVRAARAHKGRVLLRVAGVESPEAVHDMLGWQVTVPRNRAVQLPQGHFFLDDAVGVLAQLPDGTVLGYVTDVLKTGSNEVFVVNDGPDAILVPCTAGAVAEFDISARRLVVESWVVEPAL